ncbi:MAG: GNAT family protein [Spirosomataceae bacterium]
MPTTPFFHLRPYRDGDETSLAKNADNYRIWRNVRDIFPHPYTLENARQWIDICKSETKPTVFAIDIDGEVAGGIGIVLQKDIFRKNAEIGYWLGEPYWGKGIATEAVKEMTEYAFCHFNIHRLYAGVFEYNPASMQVLKKAGFHFEAILRKSVYKEDSLWDEHIYVKFRE